MAGTLRGIGPQPGRRVPGYPNPLPKPGTQPMGPRQILQAAAQEYENKASAALSTILKGGKPTGQELAYLDADGDGRVTAKDVTIFKKKNMEAQRAAKEGGQRAARALKEIATEIFNFFMGKGGLKIDVNRDGGVTPQDALDATKAADKFWFTS